MAEYIEREALLSHLYSKQEKHMDIMQEIAEFPAADVKAVVHGRWKNGNCTLCGLYVGETTSRYFHYCPNCWAKMDGGKEDVAD